MFGPLTVAFAALHRGPVQRQWRLETPEPLGAFPGLGAVDIHLGLRGNPRDGVRVRGTVESTIDCECSRCLAGISLAVRANVDVWFRTESQVIPGEDGVWPFGAGAGDIDLAGALREELLLAIPEYPVCAESCAGLCPSCGARLADEECACPPPGADPRWAVLTELVEGDLADADEADSGDT
jgi:uncharacterized protein